MGFFGSSFDYKVIDPQHRIDNLANEDLTNRYKYGIGAAGRSSKRIINSLDSGEDASKYLGADFAAIDANAGQAANQIQGDTSKRLAYTNQLGLKAGIDADALNQLAQNTSIAKAGSVGNLRGLAYGTNQGGRNAQNEVIQNAAALREKQLADAAAAEANATKGPTGGSIFGKLLQGGLTAAGAAFAGPVGAKLGNAVGSRI